MKNMNEKQLYYAIYHMIDHLNDMHPIYGLGTCISQMSPFIWSNCMSGDPAIFWEYLDVLKTLPEQEDDYLYGYQVFRPFLKLYEDAYQYKTEEIMAHFSMEEWKHCLDRALEQYADVK